VAPAAPSHYQQLGVSADADLATLRQAYRRTALECHPDRANGDAGRMAAVNAAWAVLSDPARRAAYDRTLGAPISVAAPPRPAAAPHRSGPEPLIDLRQPMSRKEAWFTAVRVQTRRLGSEAARSAAQALAQRHRRPRAVYDLHVDEIVGSLGNDIESRVQRAREAGAPPLDLALASALVGIRDRARVALREAQIRGVDDGLVVIAELLDRTWDNLAHGVTRELEQSLGGNPRLLRSLTGRRV
jgi:curved DNA-binding protein CbpA